MTPPLSYAMLRALYGLAEYDDIADGVHGLAAHGGLGGTVQALRKRGLIEENPDHDPFDDESSPWRLTDAGREAAPEEQP